MYTFVGDGFFSQSRLSRHNCRVNKPENTRKMASYFMLNDNYNETQVIRTQFAIAQNKSSDMYFSN